MDADANPIRTFPCGCCTGGCVCFQHHSPARGIVETTCNHHLAIAERLRDEAAFEDEIPTPADLEDDRDNYPFAGDESWDGYTERMG